MYNPLKFRDETEKKLLVAGGFFCVAPQIKKGYAISDIP